MNKLIGILIFALFTTVCFCQVLPRGFAEGELEAMPEYILNAKSVFRGNSLPPDFKVRPMAEWESSDAVLLAWENRFRSIQREIVKYAHEQCQVIISCLDSTLVKDYLAEDGIDPNANIKYVIARYNSIWIRDYGPNSAYNDANDSLIWVDWIYNRPRYSDDTLARTLSKSLDIPLYQTYAAPYDLVNTGGNYMSDGVNLAFSSELVDFENGQNNMYGQTVHSRTSIDTIMTRFLGTGLYAHMPVLPYDGIHHIDMHMKLIDERTLLVGKYPNDVADGAQINLNIEYLLDHYTNAFGKPFDVVNVWMPKDFNGRYPHQGGNYLTYANALIINKLVIVPIYGVSLDASSLEEWRSYMPGYQVVGINCSDIIPSSGAIHCITKEVGTKDPLYLVADILPRRMLKTNQWHEVSAIARHKSGIDDVVIHFTYVGANGQIIEDQLDMTLVDSIKHIYHAFLPESADTLKYYITARARSGKIQHRPMPAPNAYFTTVFEAPVSTSIPVLPEINIYPNPAKSLTVAQFYALDFEINKANIFNLVGVPLNLPIEYLRTSEAQKFYFNASTLKAGNYLIRFETKEGKNITKMFTVVN